MDLNELLKGFSGAERFPQTSTSSLSTSSARKTNHAKHQGGMSGGMAGFPADMTQFMSELMGGAGVGGDAGGPQTSRMLEEMMRIVGDSAPHGLASDDANQQHHHHLHNNPKDIFANVQLQLGPRVSASSDDWTRWTCVYPQYLDSKLSVKQGRRVSRDYAVARPHCYEIARAADRLGIRWIYENLGYARDSMTRGRVRFDIIDQASGSPKFPDAPNKTVLLQRLCFEILLIREEDEQLQASVAAAAAAAPLH